MLGLGASLSKLIEACWDVYITFLTDGEIEAVRIPDRRTEAQHAANELRVTSIEFLGFPTRSDLVDREVVLALVAALRASSPALIFVPHEHEEDRDHRATYYAAMEAVWLAGSDYVAGPKLAQEAEVRGYEIWTPIQRPQLLSKFGDHAMGIKMRALTHYKSQLRNRDYGRAIAGLNQYRGMMLTDAPYAEAFTVELAGDRYSAQSDDSGGHRVTLG